MAVATVVGGAGRMGGWFAAFLKNNGYSIIISDSNKPLARRFAGKKHFKFLADPRLAVQQAELVILATPTEVTKNILKEIEPYLSRNCLLVEISSIKKPVRATLQDMKRRGIAVLSIHPMFGAGIKDLAGKTIVTTMLPRSKKTSKFLSLFRRKGAMIIHSEFDQHDKYASITLALPHFMSIALVNALRSCRFTPNQLKAVAGTTFRLQLLIAEALYQENFDNEASILMDNKQALRMLKAFVKENNRTLSMLDGKEKQSLLQTLQKGRDYLSRDPTIHDAYGRFNAAVEASSLN
jgi:prephenate dehydrogenase